MTAAFTRRGMMAAGAAALLGRPAGAETIRRGGTLSVFLELDVKSLDPLGGNATVVDRKVFNLYAESLLQQGKNFALEPWLAESWDVENGGHAVVFHLRPGVTFQDGTPFDAAAAKFNLDRLIAAGIGQLRQYVREMRSVEVLDDRTIRVHLDQPSALFLPMMANEAGAMISPTAFRALGGDAFARNPVGTGAFRVTARATGEVTAVRSETYWGKGADGKALPYLDGVHLSVNANSSVRLVQLMSGTAQLCDPVPPKDFAQVKRTPDLDLLDVGTDSAYVVSFNITRPPFDNLDLRRAVVMAIDRPTMARLVTQSYGGPLKGIEPPNSWVYDEALRGHVFDPEQAKALYAKSGHSGPVSLSIVQRDPDTQIAEIMQGMVKRAGIELRVDSEERIAFLSKVAAAKFDLALTRSLPGQRPDPDLQYAFAYSRGATLNYSGFRNDGIFDLVDDAHSELDNAKRKTLYVQIQQAVLDNCYQTFLLWSSTKEVASRRLQGIKHDATGIWRYEGMWLET